jgi:hypothetical protein
MLILLLFICVIIYYIFRAKYINDIEFYILVFLLSLILFLRSIKIEQFSMDTKDNKIIQIKKKFNNYLEEKQINKKINNYIQEKQIKKKFNIIKNKIKTNINTTQLNKLFSLIKQKLNGYKI